MIGILLINLGTPASPNTADVRRYLREFLSDPRVIDIPALSRWLLVNLIIAPFRGPKSAEAYQKIWMKEGSPLLVYTQRLGERVAQSLGSAFAVEVAMRYGEPSISSKLEKLKQSGVSEIRVLPLYPQYASSTTCSTEEAVLAWKRGQTKTPEIKFLPPFYTHPTFLEAWKEVGNAALKDFDYDHILFSFHGLPERHILKEDVSGKHCLKNPDCCEKIVPANGMCYRAHCVHTAYGIAEQLNLSKDKYTICFQSRLGRTPWIQPFTDLVIPELAGKGVKKLAVFCPSFVADCLETLEEIGIRAVESFREAGGEELKLIPSLNDHPKWVEAVCQMVQG